MKRLRRKLDLGIRVLSPKIAAFCGMAAVGMVLLAVVVAPRLSPTIDRGGLTHVETATSDIPYDLFITHAGGSKIIHQNIDASDAAPYSSDEIGLRMRQAKNRHAPITRALLVVRGEMSMQELTATIAELKQLGIVSVSVSSTLPDAEP